jgi:2-phospho-L-lactate guanylyltransferase (CobY/MobA/RfbA family)
MATALIPFRSGGKTRLPVGIRGELSLAMLRDVLEAAADSVERVRLVTGDDAATLLAAECGVEVVRDPGGGQGVAVSEALTGILGPCLVVNADLPCVSRKALSQLGSASPSLVAAADGTTNALSLPAPEDFVPLYGAGSAERFASAGFTAVSIPELEQDVDTLADLGRLTLPVGAHTALVMDHHRLRLASAS